MRKLAASTAIATFALVGFAGAAHAAPQDQPWGQGAYLELPGGLCLQPMSSPPLHVPCDSTRATATYVAGERFDDDAPADDVPDAPAPQAAAMPVIRESRPVVVVLAPPLAIIRPDATPMTFELQHGA